MNLTGSAKVMVIDDESINRIMLRSVLSEEGYTIIMADNGQDALELIAKERPDLILLDAMMPQMDGFQIAEHLKTDPETSAIPLIMVTSLNDHDSRIKALQVGVEEFLSKPVDRTELVIRVRNLLRLKEYSNFLSNYNRNLEQQILDRTSQLRESYAEAIYTMTRAAEFKDEDTGSHIQRISYYTAELADALGLDGKFRDTIFYASAMHDIGKIGIPDQILLKPDQLTDTEWDVMREHTTYGAQILSDSTSPYLTMGAEIAQTHHERWDGGGYPSRLSGEQIPLSGRIMNICDQYDALRSQRPYKSALDHDQVVEIITRGDGRTQPEHFDPEMLAAFERTVDQFAEVYATQSHS